MSRHDLIIFDIKKHLSPTAIFRCKIKNKIKAVIIRLKTEVSINFSKAKTESVLMRTF